MRKALDFNDQNAYVAAQIRKYQARNTVLQAIIDKGDRIRATATGHEMVDNRTCTCGTFEARKKDHARDCAVEIVTDPTTTIAAIKECRMNDSYLDELRKQIVTPPEESGQVADALRYVAGLEADCRTLRDQVASLTEQLRFLSQAVPAELALAGPESDGAGPGDAGPW